MIDVEMWYALTLSMIFLITMGYTGYFFFRPSYFSVLIFQVIAAIIIGLTFPYMVAFFA